jgi:type I restriction enzyme S subunit
MSLSRYPRYPAYKDSGVEWLGEVPAHWEVRRLKEFSTIQLSNVDKKSVDGERPVLLCNYTDVYYNDRITASLEFMEATASEEQVHRFTLQKHDVLITKDSESWSDIAVPAVVANDLPGVLCGYHLAHIRPEDTCFGPFLARAFTAVGPRDQFQLAANGITRFGLGSEAIATGLFALPPREEQERICQFLDRETARIDALIEKKRKLIELLQEQRAAIITRAVTRGLDPHAPMKDSGVEWLGEIPAHWSALRLKQLLTQIEQGWSPDCENRIAAPEEWGVMKAGCVNGGRFNQMEHKTLPADARPPKSLEIQPGDLLMSRANGSRELVGSVAVVRECRSQLLLCDKLFRLYPDEQNDARYLAYALSSKGARAQIEVALSGGSGMANNIAQSVVKDLLLGVPHREEQVRIANFLDHETTRFESVMKVVYRAMDQLLELRASLITAAVTGAIDVRASLDADLRIDAA